MPYVLSFVLLGFGLLLLAGVALVSYRSVRRVRAVQREVTADIGDRVGLLKARTAGLRIAFTQRFGRATE